MAEVGGNETGRDAYKPLYEAWRKYEEQNHVDEALAACTTARAARKP